VDLQYVAIRATSFKLSCRAHFFRRHLKGLPPLGSPSQAVGRPNFDHLRLAGMNFTSLRVFGVLFPQSGSNLSSKKMLRVNWLWFVDTVVDCPNRYGIGINWA